jgi:hypothetical protein
MLRHCFTKGIYVILPIWIFWKSLDTQSGFPVVEFFISIDLFKLKVGEGEIMVSIQ